MRESMTLKTWFYLSGASGYALMLLSLIVLEPPNLLAVAWLAALVVLAESLQVRLVKGEGLSFTTSLALGALWKYGASTSMLAMVAGVALVSLWRRKEPEVILFNSGQVVWRVAGAGLTYYWLRSLGVPWLDLLGSALVYAAMNIATMGVAFSIHRRERFTDFLREHLSESWVRWIDRVGLGLIIASLLNHLGAAGVPVIVGLVTVASIASRSFALGKLEQEVDALLSMVGARAPYRVRRAERMIRLAEAMASELGLDERTLRNLRHAILLQDIGLDPELERRLERPGPLSPQDRRALLTYPDSSAKLISQIGELVPVAEIVRHAFERYDGLGYPTGLKGEAVPLASRLLAVVRAFESMTSGRAYRPAIPMQAALDELSRESGQQFDPRMVEACRRVVARGPHLGNPGSVDEAMDQLRSFLAGGRKGGPLSYGSTLVGLSSLAQSLSESLSLDSTLERVTNLVGRLTGWPNLIMMTDDESGTLQCRADWGFPTPLAGHCPLPETGLASEAAWARQPLYSADIVGELREHNPEAVPYFEQGGIKGALAVPMVARGRTIGVLCVFSREPKPFTPDQINLLSAVVGEAALALENARLFTEVQQRYADLVAMQTFNSALLRESRSAIVALDAEGRIRHLNQTGRMMLIEEGLLTGRTLEGQLWADVVDDPGLVEPLLEALRTGQPRDIFGATVFEGSRQRIIDVHISPLRDQTRLTGVVCMAHDVTEHSKMQEHIKQVEKLAAVGELAAGAAHEIRNPLTAIRGFIQLLGGRQELGASDREYVDIVLGEIDRVDCILEDLLTLARPTSPNRRPVDIHHLLDEVVLLIKAKDVGRGVEIQRKWAAEGVRVSIDPRQMKQVFLNIIQNAVEAMEGHGRVILTTGRLPQGGLVINCRDDGPGIPGDVLPRIFDPFYTTKDTGTGLGLPVSFRIVEAHGGRVEVDSAAGHGTSFRILLPEDLSPGEVAPAAVPLAAEAEAQYAAKADFDAQQSDGARAGKGDLEGES